MAGELNSTFGWICTSARTQKRKSIDKQIYRIFLFSRYKTETDKMKWLWLLFTFVLLFTIVCAKKKKFEGDFEFVDEVIYYEFDSFCMKLKLKNSVLPFGELSKLCWTPKHTHTVCIYIEKLKYCHSLSSSFVFLFLFLLHSILFIIYSRYLCCILKRIFFV